MALRLSTPPAADFGPGPEATAGGAQVDRVFALYAFRRRLRARPGGGGGWAAYETGRMQDIQGKIVSIDFADSCSACKPFCEKAIIILFVAAFTFPGVTTGNLSSETFINPLYFDVNIFVPCEFQSFCSSLALMADPIEISQNPPYTSECNIQYCVDPNSIPDPVIVSLSQTESPSSGGDNILFKSTTSC